MADDEKKPAITAHILACAMIEDELNRAYVQVGCGYDIHWVDRGLHLSPEKLRGELQRLIAEMPPATHLLLAFGNCGNAVQGLCSPNATLVIPKFHDCIDFLLGGGEGEPMPRDPRAYYLTRGWTLSDQGLLTEGARICARYGPQRGRQIMRRMTGHYRSLACLDTGGYPLDAIEATAYQMAEVMELKREVIPAGTGVFRDLLLGNWDCRFAVIPPGHAVTSDDMGIYGDAALQ